MDTTAAVHYVRRLVWRHLEKVGEPPKVIDDDDWGRLRERLRIKRDEKGEQRRLVLDGRGAGAFDHAPVLRAISADLPEVHLIVLVGGGAGGPEIFLLPPARLAGQIEECLEDIEACQ